MTAPTRAVLRGLIVSALSDSEVTNSEIDDAINEAILSVRGDMLVTSAATSPTAAASVAVPAGFVYVYSVELDGEQLPDYAWYVSEGTSPNLIFSPNFFAGVPSGTLTLAGGTFQEILTADGDSLNIDPGYISARALATIHASRGGTSSDLADWHKAEHSKWGAIAEVRLTAGMLKYGPPEGARLIRGRLTA